MKTKIVGIYSLFHFLVDLSCATLVLGLVIPGINRSIDIVVALLIYNFFAFAMQMPIGLIADKVNKNGLFSAVGCLLVALSFAFYKIGFIACLISGIGNALFHVGGGIDVLNISNKKAALSGIYVSTGAFGIFLGTKFAKTGFDKYYIMILALVFAAIVLFALYRSIKDKVKNEEIKLPEFNKAELIVIACIMLTVVIRGYVGLILTYEWKANFILALLAIFAVVGGKMLGGIIGDKIGFLKISMISLLISAVLFIFSFSYATCGIIAILLFNMTMPITLTALCNIMPNVKGLAFGMLTLALFIGAVPVIFGYHEALFNPVGLCAVTIISAIALFIGIRKYNKLMEEK